ncbi:MAG: hypothetical protein IKK82_09550, partial [Kiritimatiellae bacterium]|nr:hypothetical protein [Kiritimatiellia bacterium]
MKMFNMRKIVFLTAAAAGYAVFAANTWYVDAENGNDSWDGTADFENANPASNVGPKKTLGVFTSIVSEGDTIYVAPGYYTNGVSSASPNCRFYSSCGKISLISTGCATNTFICGAVDETVAQDEAPYGCGSAAILPVMMDGGDNVIKGITIANGRQTVFTNAREANYGGGVRFVKYTSGWNNKMVDCVVTNCVANRGGGVFGAAYALRCRFTGNYAQEGAHAQYLHMAVNCTFENTKGYAVFNPGCVGTFLNCLCRGNERGGFRSTHATEMTYVYNSVFVLDGKPASNTEDRGCNFVNCYFDYDPKDGKQVNIAPAMQTDAACRFFSSGSLRFTADGLPMSRNPVIGAAKESYYNDYFPGNVESFGRGYDLMGEVRNSGSGMEIGAVEHVHGRAYPNDWYVDAENGDDANSGKAPDLAKKTLVAIMDGRAAGDVVHAAPGVYSNGTVTVDSQEYRVKIPKGVSLVATEGAESTVILGEASAEPDGKYGTGPGAVSCVHMSETDMDSQAGVYGFTLSCGHSASENDIYGSAVRGAEGTAGIVADCLITNCVAGRGPVYLV